MSKAVPVTLQLAGRPPATRQRLVVELDWSAGTLHERVAQRLGISGVESVRVGAAVARPGVSPG